MVSFPMRTSKSQSCRKGDACIIEQMIRDDLVSRFPRTYNIFLNASEGIDLSIQGIVTLCAEVKSANRYERTSYRGKEGTRTGRFYLKKDDYTRSDIYAFAVKEVDANFRWDRTKPLEIKYVMSSEVQKWLNRHDLFGREAVKIVINDVSEMEEIDFGKLIKDIKAKKISSRTSSCKLEK